MFLKQWLLVITELTTLATYRRGNYVFQSPNFQKIVLAWCALRMSQYLRMEYVSIQFVTGN